MTRSRFLSLFALLFLAATAHAQFHAEITSDRFPGADGTIAAQVRLVNATQFEARNISFSQGPNPSFITVVPSAEWSCTLQYSYTCALAHPLAPGASAALDLRVHFDQPYQRRGFNVLAFAEVGGKQVSSFVIDDTPALYRRFVVTQTGDAGPGSLRAAIDALNADAACANVPCAVDFDIASSDPVQRITLRSPLPPIARADVLIDGTTQTLAHGDANPLGPEVEIDGAAAGLTNGIDFANVDRGAVAGLALGNFGDNAILVRTRRRGKALDTTPRLFVSKSYVGVDATGARAMPNFRGISISPGWLDGGAVLDCIISRNIRTGIFDWSEHDPGFPLEPVLRVERNRISDNGASGIFLGDGSDGALLRDNLIERNRDFGVAVGNGAINVWIFANSIAHNGNAAIDLGLDGPTAVAPQRFTPPPYGNRSPAIITAAVYDPATNTTTVRGTPGVSPIPACDICRSNRVSIYANDAAEHGAYAEAQTYLGEAQPNGSGFVFTYSGDLRGKYLTALDTIWLNVEATNFFNACDLSKAFLVH